MESDDHYIIGNDYTVNVSTVDLSSNLILDINTNENYIYADNSWNWSTEGKLWESHLPSPIDLEDMCKEYPALEKAYENFRTIYKMVEQDWVGKQKEKYSSI